MPATECSHDGDAWDFLEVLCGLTAEEWFGTASRLRSATPSSAARRALSALVRHGGLALSAWNLNDGLETVAWHMSQRVKSAARWRRQEHSRDTTEAARIAALALLVRRQLGEKQFWLLYAPFQDVCPQRRMLPQRSSSVFTESLCGAVRSGTKVQGSPSTPRT